MPFNEHFHRLIITFDGASRYNPNGPAGCGWTLREMDRNGADSTLIAKGSKYLGLHISNNQAEYKGLNAALRYMNDKFISCHGLYIRGDSEIVINQLEGSYEVRSPNIRGYYNAVLDQLSNIDKTFVTYRHIDRSRNWEADDLATRAINDRKDSLWG